MTKKIIAAIISLTLAYSACTVPVNAITSQSAVDVNDVVDNTVSPRYVNIANITAGMSINSEQKAVCNGSYFMYNSKNSDITVTLMESTDGSSNWTAIESWTDSFSTSGTHIGGGTSTNKLRKGYYYCSFVQVYIYDGNGNMAEYATCSSRTYKCP